MISSSKYCHFVQQGTYVNLGLIVDPSNKHGCNNKNLRKLLNSKTNSTCNIIGGTCNVQSLKAKELLVSDLIKNYSMDFLVPR